MAAFTTPATETLFGGAAGPGKALACTTLIATPGGWQQMQDIKPGDYVFAPDGTSTMVVAASEIMHNRPCYEIQFNCGEKIVADAQHLWATTTEQERAQNHRRQPEFREHRRLKRPLRGKRKLSRIAHRLHDYLSPPGATIKTTEQIAGSVLTKRGRKNHAIDLPSPLVLPSAILPITPYLLGAWLGDGGSNAGQITGIDPEILEQFEKAGFTVTQHTNKYSHGILGFKAILKNAGLLNNKHIPPSYLRASEQQRRELLQGLMDTDGHCNKNGDCEFDNTDEALARGVYELVASLGMRPHFYIGRAKLKGRDCGPKYRVAFYPAGPCFKLRRKLDRQVERDKTRYIKSVRRVESVPVRCIQVAHQSGMFLAGRGMVPTHNSHLMRVAMILSCVSYAGLQCYLFRRRYGDLVKNHLEGSTGFRELLAPLVACGYCTIVDMEIRFKNGSKIFLCHLQHEKDVENYRGAEIHFLGIEEATQFTEFMIRFLRTRVRMPLEFKASRLPPDEKLRWPRILYTSNPGGVGHAYFKKWFIDIVPPWDTWTTPDSEGGFIRQFIPAKLVDNPSINPEEYRKTLRGLGTPELVKALEDGDWSAVVGAYFGNVWQYERNVCKPFDVPKHWFKWRGFDWGTYKPFAALWACVSDGEPIKFYDGTKGRFPRGCIIIYREWYGCVEGEADKGIGLTNEQMATGIRERTPEPDIRDTVTDSLPFQDRGGRMIADVFSDLGVFLTQGDTSRISGWSQVYSRLEGTEEGPMLVIVEHCPHLIRTLPSLQRSTTKPEDIADGQEDHAPDVCRLICTSKPLVRDRGKPEIVEVKPEAIQVSAILERHFKQRRIERYG
jgi:hypothetical protein